MFFFFFKWFLKSFVLMVSGLLLGDFSECLAL